MRIFIITTCLAVIGSVLVPLPEASAAGDAGRGKKAFLKCVTCHSANPNTHKTGPSLSNVWGHKAGTVGGFSRYSDALVNSGVIWNDQTLDTWLQNPRRLIPGTTMTIAPIRDPAERRDIIAYLEQLAAGGAPKSPGTGERGGMMGMGSSEPADISIPSPAQRVESLRYCRDTYQLTTVAGKTLKFWEFNLRFKTDSSPKGPPENTPVLLPAGMMGGDRSFVVFHSPREIGRFIEEKC